MFDVYMHIEKHVLSVKISLCVGFISISLYSRNEPRGIGFDLLLQLKASFSTMLLCFHIVNCSVGRQAVGEMIEGSRHTSVIHYLPFDALLTILIPGEYL